MPMRITEPPCCLCETMVAVCRGASRNAQSAGRLSRVHCYARASQSIDSSSGCRPKCCADHATDRLCPRRRLLLRRAALPRRTKLWARRHGHAAARGESGSRYTPTTTFETFPFPWPPGAGAGGRPARARPSPRPRASWWRSATPGSTRPARREAELKKRTLTNLYNQRPTWLDLAHRTLDAAVLDAYGWPKT